MYSLWNKLMHYKTPTVRVFNRATDAYSEFEFVTLEVKTRLTVALTTQDLLLLFLNVPLCSSSSCKNSKLKLYLSEPLG